MGYESTTWQPAFKLYLGVMSSMCSVLDHAFRTPLLSGTSGALARTGGGIITQADLEAIVQAGVSRVLEARVSYSARDVNLKSLDQVFSIPKYSDWWITAARWRCWATGHCR